VKNTIIFLVIALACSACEHAGDLSDETAPEVKVQLMNAERLGAVWQRGLRSVSLEESISSPEDTVILRGVTSDENIRLLFTFNDPESGIDNFDANLSVSYLCRYAYAADGNEFAEDVTLGSDPNARRGSYTPEVEDLSDDTAAVATVVADFSIEDVYRAKCLNASTNSGPRDFPEDTPVGFIEITVRFSPFAKNNAQVATASGAFKGSVSASANIDLR